MPYMYKQRPEQDQCAPLSPSLLFLNLTLIPGTPVGPQAPVVLTLLLTTDITGTQGRTWLRWALGI